MILVIRQKKKVHMLCSQHLLLNIKGAEHLFISSAVCGRMYVDYVIPLFGLKVLPVSEVCVCVVRTVLNNYNLWPQLRPPVWDTPQKVSFSFTSVLSDVLLSCEEWTVERQVLILLCDFLVSPSNTLNRSRGAIYLFMFLLILHILFGQSDGNMTLGLYWLNSQTFSVILLRAICSYSVLLPEVSLLSHG